VTAPFDSSLLSGYLDGELDAEERAEVEQVLEADPSRRAELEALCRLQQSLQGLPTPQPTVDPVAAVRQRIAASPGVPLPTSGSWWLHVLPFALAASLLLAVGWLMYAGESNPTPVASDSSGSPAGRAMEDSAVEKLSESPAEPEIPGLPAAPRRLSDAPSDPPADALSRRDPAAAAGGRETAPAEAAAGPRPQRPPAIRSMRTERAASNRSPANSPAADAGFARRSRPQAKATSDEASAAAMRQAAPPRRQAGAAAGERKSPRQAGSQPRVVLRYVVPPDQQAAAVRWLEETAAETLREVPVGEAALAAMPPAAAPENAELAENPEPPANAEPPAEAADRQSLGTRPSPATPGAERSKRTPSGSVVRRFLVTGDAAAQEALRAALQQRVASGPGSLQVLLPQADVEALRSQGLPESALAAEDQAFSTLFFQSTAAVAAGTLAEGTVIELVIQPE